MATPRRFSLAGAFAWALPCRYQRPNEPVHSVFARPWKAAPPVARSPWNAALPVSKITGIMMKLPLCQDVLPPEFVV